MPWSTAKLLTIRPAINQVAAASNGRTGIPRESSAPGHPQNDSNFIMASQFPLI